MPGLAHTLLTACSQLPAQTCPSLPTRCPSRGLLQRAPGCLQWGGCSPVLLFLGPCAVWRSPEPLPIQASTAHLGSCLHSPHHTSFSHGLHKHGGSLTSWVLHAREGQVGLLGSCQGPLPFSVKLWHQSHAKVSFRGTALEKRNLRLQQPQSCSGSESGLALPRNRGSQASGQGAWTPHHHLVGTASIHPRLRGLARSKPIEARTADGAQRTAPGGKEPEGPRQDLHSVQDFGSFHDDFWIPCNPKGRP